MPNWVKTEIVFPEVTDEQFEGLVNKYCTLDEQSGTLCLDFEKVIPMPANVFRGALGLKEEQMYPGDLNWYDWSRHHWGTKWNACDGDVDYDDHSMTFNTAWNYADPVISELAKQTKLRIEAEAQNEDAGVGAIWASYYTDEDDGQLWRANGVFDYGTPQFWRVAEKLWGWEPDDFEEDE